MLDLEPIKERLAAATPGERKYEQSSLDSTFFVSALVGPGWEVLARFGIRRETDAVFDAHAPADITALIEEVERLRTKASALADAVKAQHTASRAMEIDPTPERQEALAMAAYQVGVALGAFDR